MFSTFKFSRQRWYQNITFVAYTIAQWQFSAYPCTPWLAVRRTYFHHLLVISYTHLFRRRGLNWSLGVEEQWAMKIWYVAIVQFRRYKQPLHVPLLTRIPLIITYAFKVNRWLRTTLYVRFSAKHEFFIHSYITLLAGCWDSVTGCEKKAEASRHGGQRALQEDD